MRKQTRCKECNTVKDQEILCDTCTEVVGENKGYLLSDEECTEYDFCSLKCLHEFTFAELVKEQREN